MSGHFAELPLRRLTRILGGGTPSTSPEFWNGDVPFATPKDLRLVSGSHLKSTERTLSPVGVVSGSTIAPRASVLLSIRAPIGYTVLLDEQVAFSQGCKALVPDTTRIIPAFLQFSLNNKTSALEAVANGTTFKELSATVLAEFPIKVPELGEQERIVRFLDAETAKIDHLISKQRELIALLQEHMSAFAEDLLVKGTVLEGSAPVEQRRLKHLFRLRDERNHRERQEVTLLSLYAKYGVRKYDEIEERTGNPVRTVEDYKCVRQGDIIVNIILAWMGAIGRSPYEGVISPAYDIWMPKQGVSSRYYHHLFRTKWFSGECFKRGKGIMMMRWRTYADQFGDISVPFPSPQEQEHFVSLIEHEEERVEVLVERAKRMINLLQERRSALITAAVTGQIEV